MPERRLEDLVPHDRRKFFAAGVARILRPVADAIERRWPLPVQRTVLRPPGALPEIDFLKTCYRCGACMEACPAQCIHPTSSDDENLRGTPYIDPDIGACVVCDELACMKACPSGALQLVEAFAIRMGLARVRHDVCVRSSGEDCRICVDRCPLGETAIRIDGGGRVAVIDPEDGGDEPRRSSAGRGCVGCGVCQHYCPTTPKAIVVHPRETVVQIGM
jgi:ferredoxin-type protein NapG